MLYLVSHLDGQNQLRSHKYKISRLTLALLREQTKPQKSFFARVVVIKPTYFFLLFYDSNNIYEYLYGHPILSNVDLVDNSSPFVD